jgi:ubiquinone/menaquinone biosynthesis C-methylase UbiE
MTDPFDPFKLAAFPLDDGIHLISHPQVFPGGEEAYDLHIGGAQRDDLLRSGRGAWQMATRYTRYPIDRALEIGAGGGTCSLGLIAAAQGARLLITDTSPRFLRMIRAKLTAAGIDQNGVSFATLAGEELGRLAPESVDAIVIASALHHVGDWRAFFRDARGVLRGGGTLVIQEPCREGNLMMAMALDVVLSPLWPRDAVLGSDDLRRIRNCRDSIYLLANTHVAKDGEDKHSFLACELAAAADEAGFVRSVFYSNFHFQDLADTGLNQRQGRASFVGYLNSFLEHHHGISADGLAKLRAHLYPAMQGIERTFVNGDGVPLLGCMAFCR